MTRFRDLTGTKNVMATAITKKKEKDVDVDVKRISQ